MESDHPEHDAATEQYRALLDVFESIALHRDLEALFHDLAQRLHRVVHFDYLNLILHDPARNVMRLHVLETSQPHPAAPGMEAGIDESPAGEVWRTQQPLILDDVDLETRYPRIFDLLRQRGVKSTCVLPLTTAQRRLGATAFGSLQPHSYAEDDLEFLQLVTAQIAVAVDNALNYASSLDYQAQLARERDRLHLVLEVTNAVVANLELRELFRTISVALRRVIHHEYSSLALYNAAERQFRLHALDFDGQNLIREDMPVAVEGTPAGLAFTSRKPLLLAPGDFSRFPANIAEFLEREGMKTVCCVPLSTAKHTLGTLNLASSRPNAFGPDDLQLLLQIGSQIAIALENALAYRQIGELRDKLAEEKLYLEDEIRTEYNFEEIVGDSHALQRVLRYVETVAPTDSTVCILGESGTGKELIARAIHNLSRRRERTFVKVNCAAIPGGLLESELFGHERGAFTGAIAQRIGRFELADAGTLFLDEIGDIPLELQPKLLRVLQEREFERLGSTRTIRVDVRLVTASNRDLAQMVAGREFRDDLYYRLNVFPIVLPPLRERREDIPMLVRYFVQKYARRMNRRIETIPADAMDTLVRWKWPGNVRELENFIERAVILSRGPVLQIPLTEVKAEPEPLPATTLEDAERQLILNALRATGWVIGGPQGAAARLGMKRTTLQSKMQKLGIRRDASRASTER